MEVMVIQGRVENIFDNEDFARMLREKLGEDAERYFREQTDPDTILEDATDEQFLEYCDGDCKVVDELIEEHTEVLKDIRDNIEDIWMNIDELDKDQIETRLQELREEIEKKL